MGCDLWRLAGWARPHRVHSPAAVPEIDVEWAEAEGSRHVSHRERSERK